MPSIAPPSFVDVLQARRNIAPYLARTPSYVYPALSEFLGYQAVVKHENYQPVGAFKVRGGINLALSLSAEERARGLISASTGNHGQSIAYAGRLLGIPVRIVVPEQANAGKVAAMRAMAAQVIFHGARFDDAAAHAHELSERHGYRFVHSANEPLLIAGVGTYALELLEDHPDIDTIIVPVGLGSGACGTCIAAKAINAAIHVIGVQAAAAPAVHDSWHARSVQTRANQTFAEGLATGSAAELTLQILLRDLYDFRLVGEDDIRRGMLWWMEKCHTLAESAAGAVMALAYQLRSELAGRKVALICSGANTSIAHLKEALNLS